MICTCEHLLHFLVVFDELLEALEVEGAVAAELVLGLLVFVCLALLVLSAKEAPRLVHPVVAPHALSDRRDRLDVDIGDLLLLAAATLGQLLLPLRLDTLLMERVGQTGPRDWRPSGLLRENWLLHAIDGELVGQVLAQGGAIAHQVHRNRQHLRILRRLLVH